MAQEFDFLKKEYLLSLIHHLPGMLYRCKNDNFWTMEVISDGCEDLTGFSKKDLVNNATLSYMDLIVLEDRKKVDMIVDEAIQENIPWKVEYRIIAKNGNIKWVWEQGLAIKENGKVIALEGFVTDITKNKQKEIKLNKTLSQRNKELLINVTLLNEYKKAVDKSSIVSKTSKEGIITYVNDEFIKISKYSKDELIGSPHSIIRHPDNSKEIFKDMWKTILKKKIWKGVIKNQNKEKEEYYVATTIIPMLNENNEINEFMSIRSNVTDLINKEKKIQQQTTDPLTKLPNRLKLFEELKNENNPALCLFDINRFKEINECYDYSIGDKLLIEVSTIIKNEFKDISKIFRINADKFAILKINHFSDDIFIEKIKEFNKKIKKQTFKVEEYSFNISLTCAISNSTNVYLHSETALEYAKTNDIEYVYYDRCQNLKERHYTNLLWTKKLREGFFEERFDIFLQPIISNNTKETSKYECLIRYIEPNGEIVSPYHFLEVAKKSRLYSNITKVVIDKACKFFENRSDEFSINLTIEDILNPETMHYFIDKILKYKVANRIVLEIVESEGIENFDEVSSFIENMKRHGCKIAIDDFGTGYSNFEYLMRLNVDFIKIDGSLIKNINNDKNAQTVAEIVVDFAKKLGIKTIAEYVHNEVVHQKVKELNIDYSQGYHLGEPKSVKSFKEKD